MNRQTDKELLFIWIINWMLIGIENHHQKVLYRRLTYSQSYSRSCFATNKKVQHKKKCKNITWTFSLTHLNYIVAKLLYNSLFLFVCSLVSLAVRKSVKSGAKISISPFYPFDLILSQLLDKQTTNKRVPC